jgi:RimJ/RimL family protein N-acetyltransferase
MVVMTSIQTARLVLREYTHADWPTVLAYQSDPRYLRYTPGPSARPRASRQ